jgi:hypothetical protein
MSLADIVIKDTDNGQKLVDFLMAIARGEVSQNPGDRMLAIETLARLGWGK